jgi:hypothetical protein
VMGSLGKQEQANFQEYIGRNQTWLQSLFKVNSTYFTAGIDKQAFQQQPKSSFFLRCWNFIWQSYIPFLSRQQLLSYHQLRDFSFSLVLLNETTPLDTLSDVMHLWRATRALFTAILIWTYEVVLLFLIWLLEKLTSVHIISSPSLGSLIWSMIILSLILVAARFMARAAFTRMCSIVFSLMYLIDTKNKC